MPEYLAPGVYIEEVSYRSKSIEGLSTSVAGFIGPTRYGPTDGPPELLTSYSDFERIYGGIDSLKFENESNLQINYMAHAVWWFFYNGGTKLYVSRIFRSADIDSDNPDPNLGKASITLPLQSLQPTITLRARFRGACLFRIGFLVKTSPNLLILSNGLPKVSGVREHDVLYIVDNMGLSSPPLHGIYDVVQQGDDLVFDSGARFILKAGQLNPANHRVYRLTVSARVRRAGRGENEVLWPDLTPTVNLQSSNGLAVLFTQNPAARKDYLTIPFAIETSLTSSRDFLDNLLGLSFLNDVLFRSIATPAELKSQSPNSQRPTPQDMEVVYILDKNHFGNIGSDGLLPEPGEYDGDDSGQNKTGLKSFEDIDEISIVAAPGFSINYNRSLIDKARIDRIVESLINHCEIRMRYRVAVLDAPNSQILSEVQSFRGQFDSSYAALYYPWITVLDPLDPTREINLPPSGFVAGIYARNDILHGVSKAPANEVVQGAIGFETLLNKAQQDVLNPLGINCFRFFENRGYRLWGARTISSDPDWRYISVRRYFAYLEHSIDKGTQWAVFENNNEALWLNVRETLNSFLTREWRNGALLGSKPEQAFFVRCDRSTMSQLDLDTGRLICLIGVAVVKPAEFVIFRIGQFTADANI